MRRPALTWRVVEGLRVVVSLAQADVDEDPHRYPRLHPVRFALEYLVQLVRWHDHRRRQSN